MRFFIGLVFTFYCFCSASAQESNSTDQLIKLLSYGIGNQTNETELSADEVEARAEQCFPTQFTPCELLLSNDEKLDSISAKYDYRTHIILINYKGKTKVAAPNMIKEIVFKDQNKNTQLINVAQLGRTFGRKGFYEVLMAEGNNRLVCYRYTETFLPSYNEAMHVGSKDTIYADKKDFLIFKNQKSYAINNFKPKSLNQFDEAAGQLKEYIKKEKLKFKEEEDLKKFAQYFWSL